MDFARHRGNLIDWMYFASTDTGLERDAWVLFLGKPEELKVYTERIRSRVRLLSFKLDDRTYDYIIIPILDLTILEMFRGSLYRMLKNLTEIWLRPGGRIIFAAENRNDIDRIITAKMQDGIHYPDIREITDLRERLSKDFRGSKDMLYFPYPSLSMPIHFYSEERLPQRGEEGDAQDELVKLGRLSHFAPAYLYVFEPFPQNYHSRDFHRYTPLFIRYNSSRLPKYAIKTVIVRDGTGKRHVLKESISQSANPHIEELLDNAKRLSKLNELNKEKGIRVLRHEAVRYSAMSGNGLSSILYPYVEGRSISEILGDLIRDGMPPIRELKEALELLRSSALIYKKGSESVTIANVVADLSDNEGGQKNASGVTNGTLISHGVRSNFENHRSKKNVDFQNFIGAASGVTNGTLDSRGIRSRDDEEEKLIVNPANLDMLFSNVLMDGDVPTLIDCEWVIDEDVELRFLEYRILKYWYEDYKDILSGDLFSLLRHFRFRKEDVLRYEEIERRFQQNVHGEGEESNIYAYQSHQASLRTILPLKKRKIEQEGDIAFLGKKLKVKRPPMKKEREMQRLSRVHVANLESIIKIHEDDEKKLGQELAVLKSFESTRSRIRKGMEGKLELRFPEGSVQRKTLDYVLKTATHPVRMGGLFLTSDGRNRIKGDFSIGPDYLDKGRVSFRRAKEPLVSIIIPCYNQVLYTYHCLWSIYENTDFDKTPYEVIIADDVSTDGTKDIKMFAKNIRVSRNETNQGFLKNCNHAAKRAKGKYIFFLNNDTRVKPEWLSSLVELIESDESIGMVGSKLIYPDGRLQEAGGIIWSDASGWNYGRLEDPGRPEYNYVKEVDYISGAAIMIRRDLWREIGGFDERYAPAYFEDSDLAFEVRRHGYKVVFQPKSVVVHYEGISNGTDVNGPGLKRYQLVNLEKFQNKWKEELSRQSVNDGSPNSFRARERGQDKKYILVVDHYVPTWDRDAGSKTTFQYLKLFLKKGYRVKFLGDNFQNEEPYTTVLNQMGIEVLYGPEMYFGIWKWIEANREMIDFVYFNRPDITDTYLDFIKAHTEWKCIFYGHDLHFMREYREYRLSGNEKNLRDSEKWRELELSVMKRTDMNYYPSEVEIEAIHAINPSIPVKAITAYIFDEKVQRNMDYSKREGLLFVGGFGHPPNKDGILWFANKIFPKVREKIPGIKLYIVGSKVDEEVLKLSKQDGIDVPGFVSDERLHELYQECRMVVAPLRFGAGVKGKVVEALHEGAAVVTTSCGAEGIPGVQDVILIGEDEDSFASRIIEVYNDIERLMEMSDKAVAFAEEHFSPEGAWSIISEDFQ